MKVPTTSLLMREAEEMGVAHGRQQGGPCEACSQGLRQRPWKRCPHGVVWRPRMSGATPLFLTAGFILEEGLPMAAAATPALSDDAFADVSAELKAILG
jgi:hypothetical protein